MAIKERAFDGERRGLNDIFSAFVLRLNIRQSCAYHRRKRDQNHAARQPKLPISRRAKTARLRQLTGQSRRQRSNRRHPWRRPRLSLPGRHRLFCPDSYSTHQPLLVPCRRRNFIIAAAVVAVPFVGGSAGALWWTSPQTAYDDATSLRQAIPRGGEIKGRLW